MDQDLESIKQDTLSALDQAQDLRAWDAVRVATLGKSAPLTQKLKELGKCPPELRKERGGILNRLRDELTQAIETRKVVLEERALNEKLNAEAIDVTMPVSVTAGILHPLRRTIEEIIAIFGAMGFKVVEGPNVDTDWFNFSALNIDENHPARADHDTFYLPTKTLDGQQNLLRTQTSTVQIRTLLDQEPPIRIIAPGRTYRADHDATHSPMFHQCEGMVVEKGLTLGHLKGCLVDFLRAFFGIPHLPVRFRSSYFPFTEPSMEIDIGWNRKTGELGGGSDWLEILGAGMMHSRVLANCGVDPREWQAFAFGMGIERLTMLKYGISDLRSFYEGDVRWLRHYGFSSFRSVALHEGI